MNGNCGVVVCVCTSVCLCVCVQFILVMSIIQYSWIDHNDDDDAQYPLWAESVGWMLSLLLIGQVPFWAIVSACRAVKLCDGSRCLSLVQLRSLLQPDPQWGPALQCNRLPMIAVEADVGDVDAEDVEVSTTTDLSDKTTQLETCCNGYCVTDIARSTGGSSH